MPVSKRSRTSNLAAISDFVALRLKPGSSVIIGAQILRVANPKRELRLRKRVKQSALTTPNSLLTAGANRPMSKKKPRTESQRAAGKRNLVEFNKSRGGRPAMKHGVGALIATGELPDVPGAAEVDKAVEEIIAGFVSDLGGAEAITAAQRVILSGLRLSLRVQGLGEIHLKSAGVVNKETRKPTALLTVLATFINSARLSALALGLGRVPRNVTNSLDAAMREIAEREHGASGETQ
jgi:hypothetical protein